MQTMTTESVEQDLRELRADAEGIMQAGISRHGTKAAFLASDEYRQTIYPALCAMRALESAALQNLATTALVESGLTVGDRVRCATVGLFGMPGDDATGTLVMRGGMPRVRLDNPFHDGNKKSVRWHKGWTKI